MSENQDPAEVAVEALAQHNLCLCDKCRVEKQAIIRSAFAAQTAELERLRAALNRIAACEDAPQIDATGEWKKGLYCGVEDRDCRDRYDGADFGHAVGVEKALEWASNEAKHALNQNQINDRVIADRAQSSR